MEQYVGLDVSQDVTYVCVVDREGKAVWQGECALRGINQQTPLGGSKQVSPD